MLVTFAMEGFEANLAKPLQEKKTMLQMATDSGNLECVNLLIKFCRQLIDGEQSP